MFSGTLRFAEPCLRNNVLHHFFFVTSNLHAPAETLLKTMAHCESEGFGSSVDIFGKDSERLKKCFLTTLSSNNIASKRMNKQTC
jgi:uncharacterized SAM-binding protein YcdF (DUF218 family)